nr:hypothetical protein [uncultured Psychroserpens sp.]
MFKKIILWSLWTFCVLFMVFLFYMSFIVKAGPVNHSKDNSVEVTGIVDSLYEGGVKDLVFKLKKSETTYYINRALENKFDLHDTKNQLLNKEITLWYSKHRSGPGGHMMQLQYQDSIYYSEWKIPLASKN